MSTQALLNTGSTDSINSIGKKQKIRKKRNSSIDCSLLARALNIIIGGSLFLVLGLGQIFVYIYLHFYVKTVYSNGNGIPQQSALYGKNYLGQVCDGRKLNSTNGIAASSGRFTYIPFFTANLTNFEAFDLFHFSVCVSDCNKTQSETQNFAKGPNLPEIHGENFGYHSKNFLGAYCVPDTRSYIHGHFQQMKQEYSNISIQDYIWPQSETTHNVSFQIYISKYFSPQLLKIESSFEIIERNYKIILQVTGISFVGAMLFGVALLKLSETLLIVIFFLGIIFVFIVSWLLLFPNGARDKLFPEQDSYSATVKYIVPISTLIISIIFAIIAAQKRKSIKHTEAVFKKSFHRLYKNFHLYFIPIFMSIFAVSQFLICFAHLLFAQQVRTKYIYEEVDPFYQKYYGESYSRPAFGFLGTMFVIQVTVSLFFGLELIKTLTTLIISSTVIINKSFKRSKCLKSIAFAISNICSASLSAFITMLFRLIYYIFFVLTKLPGLIKKCVCKGKIKSCFNATIKKHCWISYVLTGIDQLFFIVKLVRKIVEYFSLNGLIYMSIEKVDFITGVYKAEKLELKYCAHTCLLIMIKLLVKFGFLISFGAIAFFSTMAYTKRKEELLPVQIASAIVAVCIAYYFIWIIFITVQSMHLYELKKEYIKKHDSIVIESDIESISDDSNASVATTATTLAKDYYFYY